MFHFNRLKCLFNSCLLLSYCKASNNYNLEELFKIIIVVHVVYDSLPDIYALKNYPNILCSGLDKMIGTFVILYIVIYYCIIHRLQNTRSDIPDSHTKVSLSFTANTAKGHGMWHGKITTTAEEMWQQRCVLYRNNPSE